MKPQAYSLNFKNKLINLNQFFKYTFLFRVSLFSNFQENLQIDRESNKSEITDFEAISSKLHNSTT